MLLRFSVANHLSIRDNQAVSFVATSSRVRNDLRVPCDHSPSGFVLPSILLLGANGSGKSNLVHALKTMRSMVLWSHTRWSPTGGVARHPFLLDDRYTQEPSYFELDFVVDDIPHHYQVAASDSRFLFERLCVFPKSRQRVLFERNGDIFRFGRHLKGLNHRITKLTRSNSLYLSTAALNGHDQLAQVFEYFQAIDITDWANIHDVAIQDEFQFDRPDQRVIDFLREIGTGVVGYRSERRHSTEEGEIARRSARRSEVAPPQVQIDLTYRNISGQEISLPFAYESTGIQRLLVVLNRVFRALDAGGTLCIDGLDVSLHTQVVSAILRLFSLQSTNPNKAQLLATVHDTNILRSVEFRKDQFWFTEKDFHGATTIYPLSDIRTRKNRDLGEAYLDGRFGAIPPRDFISTFEVHDREDQVSMGPES